MMYVLLLLVISILVSSEYMYDLETDPYESYNIQNNDAYSSYKSYLQGRVTYWQTKLVDPTVPDWSTANATFQQCGGICPWLDDDDDNNNNDDNNNDDIEVIYNYDNAPNIVMVVVDDWGYNDIGFRSDYLSWTTPNIDKIATEGIVASNFWVHYMCVPTRGALLTGRYALRLGLWEVNSVDAEMLTSEITMAQELKSAAYRTTAVGKWHLGMSKSKLLPCARGFDTFFGLYGGYIDYWTKEYEGYIDLHEDDTESTSIVTDSNYLDNEYHNAYLLQSKAESVIKNHAINYPTTPLFLLYSMQLIHYPWEAPDRFLSRCDMPTTDDEAYNGKLYNYCGMNLLLDEAIANLSCSITSSGLSDNTILMIFSDNGGEQTIVGNSYPLRGHKGSLYRGGMASTLIIYSPNLLSDTMKGNEYKGLLHVTDLLPTVMRLATNNKWTGSMGNKELDGFDMWDYINENITSPRTEIVHFVDSTEYSIQTYEIKLNGGGEAPNDQEDTNFVFTKDLNPNNAYFECESDDLSIIESIYESTSNWKEIYLHWIPFYLVSTLLFLILLIIAWIIIIPSLSGQKQTFYDPNELQKLTSNDNHTYEGKEEIE